MTIRISTPAVPGDWHAEQLGIFKDYVERSLPGQFDVQIFLNATLFQQGTEPAQMMRGNLDMAMISAQDIAKQLPEYSIFTAGYLIRDVPHQKAVFYGDVGKQYFKAVSDKMEVTILAVGYLGTKIPAPSRASSMVAGRRRRSRSIQRPSSATLRRRSR